MFVHISEGYALDFDEQISDQPAFHSAYFGIRSLWQIERHVLLVLREGPTVQLASAQTLQDNLLAQSTKAMATAMAALALVVAYHGERAEHAEAAWQLSSTTWVCCGRAM